MNTPAYITNHIEIKAGANIVWDALTNPAKTKLYMFGCEAISDWKIGSDLLWIGDYNGRETIFATGYIISITPHKQLVYSTFDPNGVIENKPENYLKVTYDLEETNGITTLTVTQGDYSTVANGPARYMEAYNGGNGWMPILEAIKQMIEHESS